jgi:hypothetical protein
MKNCIKCGSYAFNLYAEGIDQGGFCDVHYWQDRAHRAEAQPPLPVQECPNYEDCKGACFQCEYFNAETGMTEYPAPLPAQPAQEQWLQGVIIKIEAALLSHRLSLHNDADDDGIGFLLVDALCCGQTSLDIGKQEVEDIAEAIYHVLAANTPPPPAAQPAQEPTDKQVEAAIDVWFESSIVEQSYQSRMRAAFAAAYNIGGAKP